MTQGVRSISTRHGAREDGVSAPEKVLAGSGRHSTWNVFSDATGQFHTGIWSGEPGRLRVAYTENEVCVILKGRVVLTDAQGASVSYGPGDMFVIEAGFSGTWESLEPVEKLYVIFEPAS